METQLIELAYALDTLYFLVMGAFVMWMAAGFTMLEAGLVRAKNTAEILTKNISLYSLSCIMYMVVGYNLMYPGGGSGCGGAGRGGQAGGSDHDPARNPCRLGGGRRQRRSKIVVLSRFDFVELFVSLTAQSIAVPGQWYSDRRHHIPPRHRAERAAGGGKLSRYRWRLGCILLKMPAISLRTGGGDPQAARHGAAGGLCRLRV